MDFKTVISRIEKEHPGSIVKITEDKKTGANEIVAQADGFYELMASLHRQGFDLLSDIVGIDRTPRSPRFDLIYLLLSTVDFTRFQVRLQTEEDREVPSVSGIWHSANWAEREVYDLLGITFAGHPDLRRILTWKNFEGHPLRKDFPVEGRDFDQPFDPETVEDY